MSGPTIVDYSEFRQTYVARPPVIVHGVAGILCGLLVAAVLWSAMTRADLVVLAPGRVRPVGTPVKITSAARGEVLSASHGGRVIEVHAREGNRVTRNQVLIRLDTTRLTNEIAKCRARIHAAEEEGVRIRKLDALVELQYGAVRQKAEAELTEAHELTAAAEERQAAELRLAESEMRFCEQDLQLLLQLAEKNAATDNEVMKARQALMRAQANLEKAKVPVDRGRVAVLQRALDLIEKDYAVKRQELASKVSQWQTELDACRIELSNLELEDQQSELRAPIDGMVINGDVKVGDFLEPNKPILEIAELQGYRFEARVPTDDVAQLYPGMPVRIKLDAYDYQRYGTIAGSVESVSPDSEPMEGEHRHAYLVRVKLQVARLGRGPWHGDVKLGMVGRAEMVIGQESLLALFVKRIRQSISLG